MNVNVVPVMWAHIVKSKMLVIPISARIMEFVWTFRKATRDPRSNASVPMVSACLSLK